LRDLHEKQLARLAEYVRRDDIRAAQNAETVIEDDDAPQMGYLQNVVGNAIVATLTTAK
jgi:hypothetical protein